jgi:hypothetical protein
VSAYTPAGPGLLPALLAVYAATLAGAWAAQRLPGGRRARVAVWALAGSALAATLSLVHTEPPGVRMLAIIGALLFGAKALVLFEWHARTADTLAPARFLAFTLGWPGMRPGAFTARGTPGAHVSLAPAGRALAAGGVLLALARWTAARHVEAATWLALPALSLVFHFGLFRLLAALWSARGMAVEPVFVAPLRSASLRELWGRRWNTAFSDLTSALVYRPLTTVFGPTTGLAGGFLFSGILHELAISVPARGGYGGPLAYFALHGVLVACERALDARGCGLPPTWSRAWTAAGIVLPLPLLFHAPFRDALVRPLLG